MTQLTTRAKMINLLQRYANVPALEAAILAADADESATYATETALLADAPEPGTIAYAEDTGALYLRGASAWSSLSGAEAATKGPITLAVDYNAPSAAVVPSGKRLGSQAEVDAFLSSVGATAFKYLQEAWNTLPAVLGHAVTINAAAGVHRPRAGDTTAAWDLRGKLRTGFVTIAGAAPSSYTVVAGAANAISAVQTGNDDPFITCSGTPFTGLDLRGCHAVLSTGQTTVIWENDASTLRVLNNLSPAPSPGVHTVTVAKPSTVFRNSLDDVSPVATSNAFRFAGLGQYPQASISSFGSGCLEFRDVMVQDFAAGFNTFDTFFALQEALAFTRCTFDARTYVHTGSTNHRIFQSFDVGYLFQACAWLMPSSTPIPGATYNTQGLFALGVSPSFLGCFVIGGRSGWLVNNAGLSMRSCVLAEVSTGGTDAAGILLSEVPKGSIVTIYNASRAKLNEMRNFSNAAVPCLYLSGAPYAEGYRPELLFAGCAGTLVKMDAGASIGEAVFGTYSGQPGGIKASTVGAFAANTGLPFDVSGRNTALDLDSNTTISTAAGEAKLNGAALTYAAIQTAPGSTVRDLSRGTSVRKPS